MKPSRWKLNLLYDELEAAATFGYRLDDWWIARRDDRALMTAFIRLRGVKNAMDHDDAMPRKRK